MCHYAGFSQIQSQLKTQLSISPPFCSKEKAQVK